MLFNPEHADWRFNMRTTTKLGVYTKEHGFFAGITADDPIIKKDKLTVVSAVSYRSGRAAAIVSGRAIRRQMLAEGKLVESA